MSFYLDHSATTPISEVVRQAIQSVLNENYGNPSSLHRMGLNAEKAIKKSRLQIASTLNTHERSIYFTSGGTEANNLAILGSIRKEKGRLITTAFEHPSVLQTMQHLEKQGYDVIYLPIDGQGHISVDALNESLSPQTQLVSIMYVNNEIGSIQNIEALGACIRRYNTSNGAHIKFHVDAVQAYGKIPIDFSKLPIDLMTISAHKINALKGCGALIVGDGIDVKPQVFGGGQEKGIRPGTENIIGIVAFGAASEGLNARLTERFDHVQALKSLAVKRLGEEDGISINGSEPQSPYILSVAFGGVRGEVLLHALETAQVYVSTGSACSSKKQAFSHVLKAMKLEDAKIDGTLRLSFASSLSLETIEAACDIMLREYRMLKKMMRRR